MLRRFMCYIGLHQWKWYLPNTDGTIVGTQWCPHCQSTRGILINKDERFFKLSIDFFMMYGMM